MQVTYFHFMAFHDGNRPQAVVVIVINIRVIWARDYAVGSSSYQTPAFYVNKNSEVFQNKKLMVKKMNCQIALTVSHQLGIYSKVTCWDDFITASIGNTQAK